MTTPREDAIAALRHDVESLRRTAAEQAIGHADSGGRSFDHWEGQAYAYDEVLARLAALAPADQPREDAIARLRDAISGERADWSRVEVDPELIRAALGAEAETPDRMSPTVGGKYPEAACHHDAQWLERYTDRAIRAYRQQHPDLLNLASPEAAEELARALRAVPPIPDEFLLHKAWVESDWLPNARDYAAAILAAWRQSLDSPEVR